MKKRFDWIDIGKAICILLVISVHSRYRNNIIEIFFAPFFLSFFFFLSGYVYNEKYTCKEYIIKRIKGLLVPWFIFGLFNIGLSQVLTFGEHLTLKEELLGWILQIRGQNDKMWFLACLFVSSIVFMIIMKTLKKKSILVSFVLSTISIILVKYFHLNLPWHMQTIFTVVFLMNLGYLYKMVLEEKIQNVINPKMKSIIFSTICVLYFLIVVFNYRINGTGFGINSYNCNIIVWYLGVLLGISMMIYICKFIEKLPHKFIVFIGKNSLIYYALHGKLLSVFETVINSFFGKFINNNDILKCIILIFIVGLVALCLTIPTYIINQYIPFVVGKKYEGKNMKGNNYDKSITFSK